MYCVVDILRDFKFHGVKESYKTSILFEVVEIIIDHV